MKRQLAVQHLMRWRRKYLYLVATILVLTIAVVVVVITRAQSSVVSIEAERGAVSSAAGIDNDSSASAGQAVKFGAGSCVDPSGECLPADNLAGWNQVALDDFTVDAPLGSFATSDGDTPVYTGDHGTRWNTYPDGWPATNTGGNPAYWPSKVLSVHDGVLDYYLRSYNNLPVAANLSPVLSSGSQYQTYGRYSIRLKLTYDNSLNLDAYAMALLLWPADDTNWQFAESDFPETGLDGNGVCAYSHYGGSGAQDQFCDTVDITSWHTYAQEWGPGYRKYYVDGTLIGTATNQIFSQPERWQLQVEPTYSYIKDASSGHVLIDWVAVWAKSS